MNLIERCLLADTGVDNGVVVHFDKEMASLSSYEFMRDVLRDQLNVKKLVIGYDNRFGHNRDEGFDDYVRFGLKNLVLKLFIIRLSC